MLKQLWILFSTFFKIGICTFGGGYAMIPLIETEAVEKKKWVTHEDVLDMIAIAEATPGVLAVNSATFVGYRVAGLAGSAAATLGVVLPSFIIILLVSLFYNEFRENVWVDCAFKGIRAAVVALMLNAVVKLSKHIPKMAFTFTVFGAAFVLAAFTDLSVIVILLMAAAAGIVFQLILAKKEGDKK